MEDEFWKTAGFSVSCQDLFVYLTNTLPVAVLTDYGVHSCSTWQLHVLQTVTVIALGKLRLETEMLPDNLFCLSPSGNAVAIRIIGMN